MTGTPAKLANFALFHVGWFAAVEGAARGSAWAGPAAFGLAALVHLALLVPRGERRRELAYLLAVGAAGTALDSALHASDLLLYPGPAGSPAGPWTAALVPPWITSLWFGFATLPRLSLAWLRGRPLLAAAFGAVGGPLSFHLGTRLGPIAAGEPAAWTYGALALEYAVAMPLMLALAPRPRTRTSSASASSQPSERAPDERPSRQPGVAPPTAADPARSAAD